METETEVGAADHPWIILGLEPPGPQVHAAGRQSGKSALELHAPGAVARDEDRQVGESAARTGRCLPTAHAILQPQHRVDHHVEVLVLGPAGWTHHEADST